jgi:hypothetical protein
MSEERNITFNLTFQLAPGVTPFKLILDSARYESGSSTGGLPGEIMIPAAGATCSFGACGDSGTVTGTQGAIFYRAGGYPGFLLQLFWDIPFTAENSGNIILSGDTKSCYQISGDTEVPGEGDSVIMNTVITQVSS